MPNHLDHTSARARCINTYKQTDVSIQNYLPSSPNFSMIDRSSNGSTREQEKIDCYPSLFTNCNANRVDSRPRTSPSATNLKVSPGNGRRSPSPDPFAASTPVTPSRCSTPAFRDSISRFEQYASLRNTMSPQTIQLASGIGPGCYETGSSFRSSSRGGGGGGGNRAISATGRSSSPTLPTMLVTKVPADATIFPAERAPPVGTYTIPQIMQPHTYGEMGIQVSSSFKSSGRSKQLMGDAKYFHTVRDDVRNANLGPGSYESVKYCMSTVTVSPTANDREYRSHRAADKSEDSFRTAIQGLKSIRTSPIEFVPLPCASHGPVRTGGTKLFSPISSTKATTSVGGGGMSISGRPRKQRVRSGTFSLRDKDIKDVQQLPVYD